MTQPTQFSLFTKLPYDIRHQIYVLATPPRVVRIQEVFVVGDEWYDGFSDDEDWINKKECAFKTFEKDLHDGPLKFNLKLHPDLASFAHNWRSHIPLPARRFKQAKLEAYGFTSNRDAYEPWKPTSETPEIPIDQLTDFPELAFELVRNSYFCSPAAIPPFLHVCTESRQVLVAWGYQLAFSTRSNGPRTWFHFGRDRLHIPKHEYEYIPEIDQDLWPATLRRQRHDLGYLLSGCCWDVGQFLSKDLRRVKHLVLAASGIDNENISMKARALLPLFTNLENLFLETWCVDDMVEWFADTHMPAGRPLSFDEKVNLERSLEADPLDCIPVSDIDVIGQVCWLRQISDEDLVRHFYHPHGSLSSFWYRPQNMTGNSYIEHIRQRIEREISPDLKHNSWTRSPSIRLVHVCPRSLTSWFMEGRNTFWNYYNHLRQKYDAGIDVYSSMSHESIPMFPFAFKWEYIESAGRAWVREYELDCKLMGIPIDPVVRKDRLIRWYFHRMEVPEPSQEVL